MASITNGTTGNDILFSGAGDQTIFAGAGKDTVVFTGTRADYNYSSSYNSATGATVSIVDNRFGSPDGSDTLFNVEILQFSDGVIDFTQPKFPTNTKPSFLSYTGSSFVSELTQTGTVLGTLSAYDIDGDPISFALTNSYGASLRIEGNQVVLTESLDYETWSSVHFDVTASDGRGGYTNDTFLFLVKNEPDLAPNTAPTAIRIGVSAISESRANGTTIARLSATDAEGDAVTFALKDDAGGYLQIENGEVLKLSRSLDYETAKKLSFTVIATDARGASSEQTFTIGVKDEVETFKGTARSETVSGGVGADRIFGFAGNDRLNGEAGNDTLNGGTAGDKFFGGIGADTFVYQSIKDSFGINGNTRDSIFDFSKIDKDRIDLSAIDANTKLVGNQAFVFIGSSGFHGKAGELRFDKKASDTYIYADINGDKKADLAIHLDDAVALDKGFFLL